MKKILVALVAVAFASVSLFAQAAAAPAATAAPAAAPAVAAPAATQAAPAAATTMAPANITLGATLVKIVAANSSKASPAQIVLKTADGKEIILVLNKSSTFKAASGKAIKISALKAGAAVTVVYIQGEKVNTLVSLSLKK